MSDEVIELSDESNSSFNAWLEEPQSSTSSGENTPLPKTPMSATDSAPQLAPLQQIPSVPPATQELPLPMWLTKEQIERFGAKEMKDLLKKNGWSTGGSVQTMKERYLKRVEKAKAAEEQKAKTQSDERSKRGRNFMLAENGPDCYV